MQGIYLDNAATSFPKAPRVGAETARYLEQIGANPNRGSYGSAVDTEMKILLLRERLCSLFDMPDVESCIFCAGATEGLNLLLKGTLHAGDHVLVSSMEHNSVMRPLHQISADVEQVPCASDGSLAADDVARRIRPDTKLVCMTHASNVCGTVLPIAEIGALCREHGVPFVVDAAQSAGHVPISGSEMNLDALVVPAHKGLLGPQGLGCVLMKRSFADRVQPLVCGGTGSRSDSEEQPLELPDRFESGTQNVPAMYGLDAALDTLIPNMEAFSARTMKLCGRLLEGAARLDGVRLLGKDSLEGRVAVVSLDFPERDNAVIADRLSREYGIATRCGLHCAPSAHRTLGSFPQGSVRFSLGWSNTEDEIDATLAALRELLKRDD